MLTSTSQHSSSFKIHIRYFQFRIGLINELYEFCTYLASMFIDEDILYMKESGAT